MAKGDIALDIIANDRASATFDKVGSSAQESAGKLDRAAGAMDSVGSTSSQTAGGIGDLGGALALLPGPLGAVGTGMEMAAPAIMGVTGAADLASVAMAKFPAVAGAASKAARGVGIAFRFMMGPAGLVIAGIALVAAGLVLAYKKSETFRNIVNGAFGAVKRAAEKLFAAVRFVFFNFVPLGIVIANFDKVVGFIKGVPGKIKELGGKFKEAGKWVIDKMLDGISNAAGFVADIAGNIWNAVKGLLNKGIDKINSTLEFTIKIPGPVPDVHINPPNIPHLAKGGIVRARPGGTLALIGEAGHDEAVVPLSGPHAPRGGGGGGGHYVVDLRLDGKVIQRLLLAEKRRGGGLELGIA